MNVFTPNWFSITNKEIIIKHLGQILCIILNIKNIEYGEYKS